MSHLYLRFLIFGRCFFAASERMVNFSWNHRDTWKLTYFGLRCLRRLGCSIRFTAFFAHGRLLRGSTVGRAGRCSAQRHKFPRASHREVWTCFLKETRQSQSYELNRQSRSGASIHFAQTSYYQNNPEMSRVMPRLTFAPIFSAHLGGVFGHLNTHPINAERTWAKKN